MADHIVNTSHRAGILHVLPGVLGRVIVGHVSAVRPILDRLQDLRFRVSAELREHILTLAGEA